jgi:large subunit ribosomal protein L30
MTSEAKLRITWVKSSIGYSRRQKGTIRALGLRRLGDCIEQADTPAIRGMLAKVSHLVQISEVQAL